MDFWSKNRSKIRCDLGSIFGGSWVDFGVDLGAKLGPSWGQVGAKLGSKSIPRAILNVINFVMDLKIDF